MEGFVMEIPVSRVDDYTLSLIQDDIVRFFPMVPACDVVEPEVSEADPEPEAEVKPRRGRPRKNAAAE